MQREQKERGQKGKQLFCCSHVWSSLKMLLLYCQWSCSPWSNSRRCTDLFTTLPHQVYYTPAVHLSLFLREMIMPAPFFFFYSDEKAESTLVRFHFLCSRSFYRWKSRQSLYLKAITRNHCFFSAWLNTNKSDPLYFPLNKDQWTDASLYRQNERTYMILHHNKGKEGTDWLHNPFFNLAFHCEWRLLERWDHKVRSLSPTGSPVPFI